MLRGLTIGALHIANNIFLAPMAGITDLPFRTIARNFGAGLCFSEMVSAQGLVRNTARSYEYLKSSPQDSPLGVQIFGSDPDVLGKAAETVTKMGADLIDINAGCPVKKVVKTGAGGAMMRDLKRFSAVVASVKASTNLPVTVKIRSGWDNSEINAVDISKVAEESGADAITIHPRTVRQGFSGTSDWGIIEKVKRHVAIPVIGSGDIRNHVDANDMLQRSGCDAIMVGRGALGNPWIFRTIKTFMLDRTISPPPDVSEREETIRRHINMHIDLYGERNGFKSFRKHLLWYTKGLRGGSIFRRDAASLEDIDNIMSMLHTYLKGLDEVY